MAIDRWITAIEADGSSRSLPAKVIADRPQDINDTRFDGSGNKTA